MSRYTHPTRHAERGLRIMQICLAGMAITLLGNCAAPGTPSTPEPQTTDDADRATAQGDIDLARQLNARKRYHGTSATQCHDCDEPIPNARRTAIAGCTRCAACQNDAEKRSRA